MGGNAVLRFVVDQVPAQVFDEIAVAGLIAVRIEGGILFFLLVLLFVLFLLFLCALIFCDGFVLVFVLILVRLFGLVLIAGKQRGVGAVLLVFQEPAVHLQQLLVRVASGRSEAVVGDLLAHD